MVEILSKEMWMVRTGFNNAGFVDGVKRGTPEYDALMDQLYNQYRQGQEEVKAQEEQRVYDYAQEQVKGGNEDVPDDWVGGDSSVTWSDVVSDIELTRNIRDARNRGDDLSVRYYEALRIKSFAEERISRGEVYAPPEVVGGQSGVLWSDIASFYGERVANRGYDRGTASYNLFTGVSESSVNGVVVSQVQYPVNLAGQPVNRVFDVVRTPVSSNVSNVSVSSVGVGGWEQGGTSMVNPAVSNIPAQLQSEGFKERLWANLEVSSSLTYLEKLRGEGVSEVLVGGVATPISEAIVQFQGFKERLDNPYPNVLISSESIVRNASFSDLAYNLGLGKWINPVASNVPMFDIQFTSTGGTPFFRGDDVPVNVAREPLTFIGELLSGRLRAEVQVSTVGEINNRAFASAIANIETLPLGVGTGIQWLGRRVGVLAPEDKAGVQYDFWRSLVGANPSLIDNYLIGSSLSSGLGYWGMEVVTDKALGDLVVKGFKKVFPAKIESLSFVGSADPSNIRGTSYVSVKYGGFSADIVSDFAGYGKSFDSGFSVVELSRTGFVKGSSFLGVPLPVSTDLILSSVDTGFSYAVSGGKSLGFGFSQGFKNIDDLSDIGVRGTVKSVFFTSEGVVGAGFVPDITDFRMVGTGSSGVLGDIYTIKGADVVYHVGGFDYGGMPVLVDVSKGAMVPYGVRAFDELDSVRVVGNIGVGIEDVKGRAYSFVRVGSSMGEALDDLGDFGVQGVKSIDRAVDLGDNLGVKSTIQGLDLGSDVGMAVKSAVDVGGVRLAEDVVKSVDVAVSGGSAGTLGVVSALPRFEEVGSADPRLVSDLPDVSVLSASLPAVDTGRGVGSGTALLSLPVVDVRLDSEPLSVSLPKLDSLSGEATIPVSAVAPMVAEMDLTAMSTASLSLEGFDTGVMTATIPALDTSSLDLPALPSFFTFDVGLPPLLPFDIGGSLGSFDFDWVLPEGRGVKKGYMPDFTALFFDLGGVSFGLDGLFSGLEARGLDI